jgi:hypothetical protein
MIKDILENAQLFALGTWNGVIDAIAPQPAKRETIRIGMARVQKARTEYRALDALLHQEAAQLATNHTEERKLLSEKQNTERTQMRSRHAEVRVGAKSELRAVRSSVITDIIGTATTSPMAHNTPRPNKARPSRAKLVPVAH